MTDLSPATQAVLDAFSTYPLRADHIAGDLVPALAAALRAAAGQVVPEVWFESDDITEARDALLAIADELEAVST